MTVAEALTECCPSESREAAVLLLLIEMAAELRSIRASLNGVPTSRLPAEARTALEAIRYDPEFDEAGTLEITKGQKQLVRQALDQLDQEKP